MDNWNQYRAPNIGWLFYKHIYNQNFVRQRLEYADAKNELTIQVKKDEKTNPFNEFYEALYNYRGNSYYQIVNPLATHYFSLYTTHPGLLAGSGYMHDTGTTGDFKIGFFFDHTTGQPVIPGSSVKGLLKSVFEMDVENNKRFTGGKSLAAIRFMFSEMNMPHNNLTQLTLGKLKTEIFGNDDKAGSDIFFDAVLKIDELRDKNIMGNDFITPHYPNLLQNPTPLMFIKVMPGIAFEFRFRLQSSEEWDARLKETLFRQILLTVGIGAKTNVGYGQFSAEPVDVIKIVQKEVSQRPTATYHTPQTRQSESTLDEENRQRNIEKQKEQPKQQSQAKPVQIHEEENWPLLSPELKAKTINATIVQLPRPGILIIRPHLKNYNTLKALNGKGELKQVIKVKVKNVTGSLAKNNLDIEIDPKIVKE